MRGGRFGDGQVDGSQRIRGESGEDIGIELFNIEVGACLENQSSKVGSS